MFLNLSTIPTVTEVQANDNGYFHSSDCLNFSSLVQTLAFAAA